MAINVSNSGGTQTVTITYSGAQAKMTNILNNAAQSIYNRIPLADAEGNPIPFAQLTSTQKLAVLDGYIKQIIQNEHKDFVLKQAASTAEATALQTVDTF